MLWFKIHSRLFFHCEFHKKKKKKKKSNAPPAIKNKELATELSCYGQLASPTEMVLLGGKSPKLNHVVCHRRRVFMPPTDTKAVLNLMFCFKFK